jgi:signal transduction histidine kinase
MPYPVVVALALTAASYIVSGLALLVVGSARVAALLGTVTGALLLIAVTLESTVGGDGWRLFVTLAAQVGVVALTTYPRPSMQHAVDFTALALVVAAPVASLVTSWRYETATGYASPVAFTTLAVLVLILHTWWRLERSSGRDRWALLWMALASGAALLVAGVAAFAMPTIAGAVGACLAFAMVGPCLYVGVGRPDVVDVRGLVVRCVVMATALLGYVALFMSVTAFLQIVGDRTPSAGALALVGALCAVIFHPFQVMLRGVVDELLFGQRPDPLGAASHVADHISDDPAEALRTIREALVLPYARLLRDGIELASSGAPVTHTRSVSLLIGNGRAAELEVGLRAGDLTLTREDEAVLRLVAPLLAQTMRAVALAADVQSSREGTVAALEEERRRLRRDLHDGLGPRLSGIAFTADAVSNMLRDDPASAEALLTTLRAETVAAINEIRQLVYAMRPPALDELGLVRAIDQQAATLRTPDGRPFRVQVEAGELPPLPAAVEVAAYRIAVEALTNAARHSGSDAATASLRVEDGALVVDVRDAGADETTWSAGAGLVSMRERAAELGGMLSAGGSAEGGAVRALLPLLR